MTPKQRAQREGHGWWPYLGPYAAFLLAVEIANRAPESLAPAMLVLKPLVPAALMLAFHLRGAYPELRGTAFRPGWTLLDILVGVGSAAMWMAPYMLIDALGRPDAADGFDPAQLGPDLVPLVLGIRMFGYALVTPFFEELFIRSFVLRLTQSRTFSGSADFRDFRDVPIAHFTPVSFWVTSLVFTAGHAPWEWCVALPWIALTNLWFRRRGNLMSVVVVHAAANASILIAVTLATGGAVGHPLWVFV